MNFPEVLKQPPTFVAAALVTACLVALLTAIGGFLLIDGATRTALTVKPVGAGAVSTSVDAGTGANGADAGGAAKTSAILR
ncbi:hypothetical protein FB468_0189 [Leucobacter komagatae]|uniref:Uncharacterized protein n=1 Tax=Leucobacter komagatae TaxID=55969 RepID=A0A542Y2A5_9MICO|nr:hypothetical protein [Leucobacter komagatae]TQL42207.1 hypothetical protein FB468_0189 [Leucobacter komagatae]